VPADVAQATVAARTSADGAETKRWNVPLFLSVGVAFALLLGGLLLWRANSRVNRVTLASAAQPVTVVKAKGTGFRPFRTYIGALEPWVMARLGPQLVSAFVWTVTV